MRTRSAAFFMLALVSSAHAEAPKEQLNQVQKHLEQSKENAAALAKQLDTAQDELEVLQERSASIAERVQQGERRVSKEEGSLAVVNAELALKQKDFEARKADYAATVVNLLRMREMPATALFTNPDNVHQLMRSASVLEKTNQAVAQKAAKLRSDMAALKRLQGDAKARDASTRAEQASLAAEQKKLAQELAKRKQLQARLSADHAKAEQEVESLSKQSQNLQDLLAKLEENEKAKAATRRKPKEGRSFAGGRGSMKSPVAGTIIHVFGERKSANETYRGLVFKARPGATVVAPYDGEVVFTGPFRDYGNMVLIKHNNGFISLIAGLGQVSAGLNQPAIKGEPIGVMPDSGPGEAYVELRDKEAKPIDPGDWFANVSGKLAQQ